MPLSFQFGYSGVSNGGWGNLNSVTYPSGNRVQYQYYRDGSIISSANPLYFLTNPVTQKTETHTDIADGTSTSTSDTWNFGWYPFTGTSNCNTITGPDKGVETNCISPGSLTSAYTIYKTTSPTGEIVEKQWADNATAYASTASTGNTPNEYVATEVRSIPSASGGSALLSAAVTHVIDENGNETQTSVYDWVGSSTIPRDSTTGIVTGPNTGATLLKTTNRTFQYYTPTAVNPSSTVAPHNYAYWSPASPSPLNLMTRSNLSGVAVTEFQHDASGNVKERLRYNSSTGNPITQPLTSGNSLIDSYTYGSRGDLTSATDPNGIVTSYAWDSTGLFLKTKVVNSTGIKSTISRTTAYTFDPATILLTSATDINNNIEMAFGYDSIGRLTSSQEASGSPAERDHKITYDDATLRIISQQDLYSKGDLLLTAVVGYDQLGRVRLTKQLEASGQGADNDTDGIKVQTRYAYSSSNNASYKVVSNPYRSATATNSTESTIGWTLMTADQDGRQVSAAKFAGAGLPSPFGSNTSSLGTITTAYTATSSPALETTTVTDEMGNPRVNGSDGLGRLTRVTEYPASNSTYVTTYGYDPLDDLTTVNQTGLPRVFAYDSLKRLIGATNPENFSATAAAAQSCAGGTYALCYSYDNDSNLLTKTDNRGISTTYVYDGLNRVVSKSYSNGMTPPVSYIYDSAGTNSIGRLTSEGNGVSATSYGQFDAMGRPGSSTQSTVVKMGSTPTTLVYPFSYLYNQAGSLTTEGYPSGRLVDTCYDLANRVTQVGLGACSAGTALSYASAVGYAPQGSPVNYTLGNAIVRYFFYNGKLQTSWFKDVSGTTTLLDANLTWGSATNNGNLRSATYTDSGPGLSGTLSFSQSYIYDGLNRITSVTDSGYTRAFSYDAYGNMWVNLTGTTVISPLGSMPTSNLYNANNQNGSPFASYDAAGNQILVTGNTVSYDAEARQTSVVGSGVNESYLYDGEGKRVEKISNTSGTPTAVFVYDVAGLMAAEYSTVVDTPSCVTCYLSTDQLGTPRLVTDQSANVVARHDYLPFGEEILSGSAGRVAGGNWGTGGDSINQKFTGKERDSESGLDYFGARYYGSALGRFTSADPLRWLEWQRGTEEMQDRFRDYLSNPQGLNMYAYVKNSPLRFVDPDGLLDYDTQLLQKKIHVHIDDNLSDKRQNELKGKLDAAISNINGHADQLTDNQTKVLGNLKTIDVDSSAKRSYSIESKGLFTLTPGYVDQSSKPYLGSAIGHDAFHMEQFRTGGLANSRGVQAEKGAFVFQLDFGQRIGIAPYEANYLKDLIANPSKLKEYYDSPIK